MKNRELLARLPDGLNIALVAALAAVCGPIAWRVMPSSSLTAASPTAHNGYQTGFATASTPDMSILTNSDPFGANNLQAISSAQAGEDAKETSLNLTLKGVRAKGDGVGVAFILLPDNRQLRANIGEEILSDVTLEYVFSDRVTLRVRGALENLYRRAPTVSVDTSSGAHNPAPAIARTRGAITNKARVTEVSAATFLGGVDLAPVREGNKRNGYRITARTGTGALTRAGFKSGDIIRQVNNRPIAEMDSEDLQELMLGSATLHFDVDRAGKAAQVAVRFTAK